PAIAALSFINSVFPADILHTDVFFSVFYGGLLIASFVVACLLNSRRLLHNTYKLYLISLLTQCIGLVLLSIYYGLYAKNGFGCELLKLIGRAFQAISTLVFLLLLILLAKGYTVTRARLKKRTSKLISIFMSVYVVIYATLFLFEAKFFDPGEVLYIYESPAGYGLIALRILGWIWFLYAIIFTLIRYPTKSAFLTRLFLLYSIWFISGPVVILISTFVVPKYMREKIINAVEILIAIEAHLVFFVLTRPSTANKNFPFHVRTTQIDVMAKAGEAGDNTLDNFTHYQYAPSKPSPSIREHSLSNHIFTVSSNGINGQELRGSVFPNDYNNSTTLANHNELSN
ncbi:transmembrane protein 145-like protein, partial [Leptotrombidium deliense]